MPRHPIEIREFRFHACERPAQERPLRLEKKERWGHGLTSVIQHELDPVETMRGRIASVDI